MQKYMMFSLLILGYASFSVAHDTVKLSVAIEKQDIEKVKRLVKEVGEFDPVEKKKLLKDANDVVGEARGNVSLTKSKWDLAKFVGGSTLAGVGGIYCFACGVVAREFSHGRSTPDLDRVFRIQNVADRQNWVRPLYITSALFGVAALVGGYLAVKGYFCDTAFGRVTHARKIADLIKKAPVKAEQQPVTRTGSEAETSN